MNNSLFIAIETEELPASMVETAQRGLEEGIRSLCSKLSHGAISSWATPRWIAVSVEDLAAQTPITEEIVTGPPEQAAYRNGEPTKAAIGFAKGRGAEVSDLIIVESKRGPVIALSLRSGGENMIDIITSQISTIIASISFPKSMRWGMGEYSWPRPIHRLIACYNNTLIPCSIFGISSDTQAKGHRLSANVFQATNANQWLEGMRSNFVEPCPQTRRDIIERQLAALAQEHGCTVQDTDLIDEVCQLVEWPVTICGSFPEELLYLPPKLLVEAMKIHQRVFPLYKDGALTEKFLAVTNQPYATQEDVAAIIAEGNKRVLTARFYDAKFFYAEDRSKTLAEHGAKLSSMLWVRKGGTVAEKVTRITALAQEWAPLFQASPEHSMRAAALCKNDLCTQMVYEFPELEGHVGMLLAGFDGEEPEVATAIEEYRMPRFSADSVAPSPVGKVVAVADRWDTLTQCFALGLQPKGSGDPLGLRRAALGFLRTIIAAKVELDLAVVTQACTHGEDLCSFLLARLRADMQERAPTDIVNAVFATNSTVPYEISERILAMTILSQRDGYSDLRAVFKRVMGLTKTHDDSTYQKDLFSDASEFELATQLEHALIQLREASNPAITLDSLCALKPYLEQFFQSVMVMVEEEDIKNNRLSLLKAIATAFFHIADFSLLSSES